MEQYKLAEKWKSRESGQQSWFHSVRLMLPLLEGEVKGLLLIIPAVLINIGSSVVTPYLISRAIDGPIATGSISGLRGIVVGLGVLYLVATLASYVQARMMGHISQRILFRLREKLFVHLQQLPIAFFDQNKTGDLISRLNNDTDKINQFLSEGILRFTSIFFSILGIGGVMLWLEWRLALAVFAMTSIVIGVTSLVNRWVRRLNTLALERQGDLSAEVQEAMSNYRVLIAFQKQAFFVKTFVDMSESQRVAKTQAEFASSLLGPLYTFGSNIAQTGVLIFGLWLVLQGQVSIGVLIGFVAYTQKFFEPLRVLGAIIGTMQGAVAGWGRVNEVLSLQNSLTMIEPQETQAGIQEGYLLELKDVDFGYDLDKMILSDVTLQLEEGKTYALVGPTGGGKSTIASLMFRLYDPTSGIVSFDGQDIRSYRPEELSHHIGFILQEPFLFGGTVADNLLYGNARIQDSSLKTVLKEKDMWDLLDSFPNKLETRVSSSEQMSLGQRQLISFIRAVLREPKLLILDEATANIDTITEAKLERALDKLPDTTTKVIIAHRLNTIEKADQIFFVGGGKVTPAGSYTEVLSVWKK